MLFFPIYKKIFCKRKGRVSFQDSPPDQKDETSEERRAPYAALKASLTLEASLVLPLFVAGIIVMMFYIQAIQIQVRIQKALFNQTVSTAGYAFYLNEADMTTEVEQFLEAEYIKLRVINELGNDFFESGYIVNGKNGFVLNLSNITEEGIVDVALQYKMQVPMDIFGLGKLNFVSRACCKTWDGIKSDISGWDTEMVYVTSSGTVYHTYDDCTYIKSQTSHCNPGEIAEKRNASGGKYYPCNLCSGGITFEDIGFVYYTTYGTRYHCDAICPNIKTNVFAIEESVAKKKYELCSKCKIEGGISD